MFYHLDGKVAELGQGMAVIDCSGVGYLVNVSLNTLAQLKNGERAKLYISESVREDAFELFGFASKSEKRSFDLLIGVSGVGPKAALSILSAHTPEALSMAILSGDEKALTVAPGIGKKIAQRVILELKDKLAKESAGFELPVKPGVTVRWGRASSPTPPPRSASSATAGGDKSRTQGRGRLRADHRGDNQSGAQEHDEVR